jgi:hypothetical protein
VPEPAPDAAPSPASRKPKRARPTETWLDRLSPRERRRADRLIAALTAADVDDAERLVRAELEGSLPQVAPALLLRSLWRDSIAPWASDGERLETLRGSRGTGRLRAARDALRRLDEARADPADLAAVAELVAFEAVARALERISVDDDDDDARNDLPRWELVEVDADGKPTGRSLLLGEVDLRRAEPPDV